MSCFVPYIGFRWGAVGPNCAPAIVQLVQTVHQISCSWSKLCTSYRAVGPNCAPAIVQLVQTVHQLSWINCEWKQTLRIPGVVVSFKIARRHRANNSFENLNPNNVITVHSLTSAFFNNVCYLAVGCSSVTQWSTSGRFTSVTYHQKIRRIVTVK
jgi:hypothetical protein